MKVLIITQGYNPVFQNVAKFDINTVGIVESVLPNNLKKKKENLNKSNIFYKLKKVFTQRIDSLSEYAIKKNIPFFELSTENYIKLSVFVKDCNPDLVIVYSMSQLLKKDVISIPPLGIINLHPSLLPSYRGGNPYIWMSYNNETKYGVTVHCIDEGEDTGDVLCQKHTHISPGTSFQKIQVKINKLGSEALLETIELIKHNNTNPIKQPIESPTIRARNVQNGWDIIKWDDWNVAHVWHFLRSASPFIKIFPSSFWKLESFHYTHVNKEYLGSIKYYGSKAEIYCKDGIIYCKLSIPFKEKIKKLIY